MTTVLRHLKIAENSLVDAGANQHARVLLAKRAPATKKRKVSPGLATKHAVAVVAKFTKAAIAKGYMDGQAETLDDAIEDQEERELLTALWDSLNSIFNDDTISEEQEAAMAQSSFDSFMTRLKDGSTPKEARMTLDLSKAAPELKAHVEKLEADLKAATTKLVELEKKEPVDVLKGLTPEAKALVEKAQRDANEASERIQKLEDENLTREYIAKAEKLPLLAKSAKDLGVLLKTAFRKLDKADYEALETLLKAANEQIDKGKVFGIVGGNGNGHSADTAYGEARSRAQELVTKGEAKTIEQGVSLVFKRDPALYDRHRSEGKGN